MAPPRLLWSSGRWRSHSDVETLTDQAGDTRATYGYTAYGKDDTQSFTGIDKPQPQNPGAEPYNVYRFNAKRFDATTGDYDMGFRDYDPGLNRFLSRDLYNGALADLNLGLSPWTMNRYGFAGGNPIGLVEDGGHSPTPDNPVSANPELNKWLTTEWDAPNKWDQQQRESAVDAAFIDIFNPNWPYGELHPLCQDNWMSCVIATSGVARGAMSGQQGFEDFAKVARGRQKFASWAEQASQAFPPGSLEGADLVISGFFRFLARMAGAEGRLGAGAAGAGTAAAGTAAKSLMTGADEAVFWSGIRGGQRVAADWVGKHGGATLETTMASRGISLPAWDASNPATVAAWRNASAEFARGASGNVRVLQEDAVRIRSVWTEVEFPALKANPNVNSITAIDPRTGMSNLLWSR